MKVFCLTEGEKKKEGWSQCISVVFDGNRGNTSFTRMGFELV